MKDPLVEDSETRLELDWLLSFRWLSLICQSLLIIVVSTFLHLSLPLIPLLCLLGVFALSNCCLWFSSSRDIALRSEVLGSVFVFDTLLLSLLLYWTGGPFNPFSVFYLLHIALAALLLGAVWTWFLVVASSACFGLLFRFHVPLEHGGHHGDSSLDLHLYGMLFAFVLTAMLIAYFLTRLSSRLRERESQVHQLRLRQLNQSRLASLATLSAGAAHELSSPLSTIAVVANELERGLRIAGYNRSAMLEDAQLIRSEVIRCRDILDQIGAQGGQFRGEVPGSFSLSELVYELRNDLGVQRGNLLEVSLLDLNLQFNLPRAGLKFSLLALIRNAFDASDGAGPVELSIKERENEVIFSVADSGVGMSGAVKERLGEPFFTTKEAGRGMGLGVYLVKVFVENWKGSLEVKSEPGEGSILSLCLPRMESDIELVQYA